MSVCPSCNNESVTTHEEHRIALCKGCSPAFCTECYWGTHITCVYFSSSVPENNWIAAETYMNSNTDKLVRLVRSGPRVQCSVVRVGTQLFRRVERDGELVSETPAAPTECCVQCGSYDRRYAHLARAYTDGFACTECANGILGK